MAKKPEMASELLRLAMGGICAFSAERGWNICPRGSRTHDLSCQTGWNEMKRATLTLLFLMMAATLFAETAIITDGWVKLRSAPGEKAKAVGLLYGNDAYPVLKTKDEWVQVRTSKGQVGWVPAAKLIVNGKPFNSSPGRTETLAKATSLQRRGYRADAQAALQDIASDHPETFEQYEAIRHLLYYFPVSMLPEPENRQVHPAGALAAGRLADIIIKCANFTPKPPPDRFWQVEYVMAGITPRWGVVPIEVPHSSCP